MIQSLGCRDRLIGGCCGLPDGLARRVIGRPFSLSSTDLTVVGAWQKADSCLNREWWFWLVQKPEEAFLNGLLGKPRGDAHSVPSSCRYACKTQILKTGPRGPGSGGVRLALPHITCRSAVTRRSIGMTNLGQLPLKESRDTDIE